MAPALCAHSLPLLLLLPLLLASVANSQLLDPTFELVADALEWPQAPNSSYGFSDEIDDGAGDDDDDDALSRRSLYWGRHYYISYGALSANRIPCPPRSGRSYYTHNCYRARGHVNPYRRGCSRITRCRSSTY